MWIIRGSDRGQQRRTSAKPKDLNWDGFKGVAISVRRTEPRSRCYKTYPEDDMQRAVEATRGGLSAFKAALNCGIPSRTLYCMIHRIGLQQEGVVKLEVKSRRPPTATLRDKNTEG
jgi:hypothetical protein